LNYDIVMLVLNDVAHDGRVRAEAAALAGAGWRVLVIGTQRDGGSLPDREGVDGYELRRVRYGGYGSSLRRPWRWVRHGIQAAQILKALLPVSTRAYHAHDLPALILLALVQVFHRRARLVYDAHELFLFMSPYAAPRVEAWHRRTRGFFMCLEGWLARRADGVLALCDGRARLLARWYGIPRPVIVRNAVDPADEHARPPLDLGAIAGAGRRLIVHTGEITNRRRSITELVEALALLPDEVALVLLGDGEGADQVRALAKDRAIAHRVFIVPPVPPDQIAAAIRCADAAVILMRAESLNTRGGLPNKFYEAVAAGLPIVASDLFVLRRAVRRYDLGLLCDADDPGCIADALRDILTPEAQAYYRVQARKAQEVLNWRCEAEKLRLFYRGILP
jgi:glycosyltransferase involved in cell wall biosynthesis